jgi:hypothetical protein
VGCQIRDAADRVALHFNVRGVHLLDQWSKAAKCDDGDFVLGCEALVKMFESYHAEHTVDSKVPQRCACCSLHLYVRILKQEQDRLQCVAVDFSNIWQ